MGEPMSREDRDECAAERAKHWNGYPCTIIADRYGGTYSGASWTAWPLDEDAIPSEQGNDDMTCMGFWHERVKRAPYPVGRGSTPNDAHNDLSRQYVMWRAGKREPDRDLDAETEARNG